MSADLLDSNIEARVRASFSHQRLMNTLGANLAHVSPGLVEISLPFSDALSQQHGYFHAGAVTSVMDSACGYAALTLMQPGSAVLAVEFKVNFLSPARGHKVLARGRVVKSGRTITVCAGEALVSVEGSDKLVATMLSTIMEVRDRGIVD